MKIAIHHRKEGFSERWISCCDEYGIDFKVVNCYSNTIIDEVTGCDALMWHFHQSNSKDALFAKQLIYSLHAMGKVVFPDFNTSWHFDDKVGQKYLMEAIGAPLAPSYVFYEKKKAMQWIEEATFPKVFKLRTGSSSSHVRLVKDKKSAAKLIRRAFRRGFRQYEPGTNLSERWRKFRAGQSSGWNLTKGILRFARTTKFDRTIGNERGYIYFQDFVEGNDHDIRVVVIDGKACAVKRMNRENDFRASGSGILLYEKEHFQEDLIRKALELSDRLGTTSLALDCIYKGDQPLFVEMSYGFPTGAFLDDCPGYWDRNLQWHAGPFDAPGWMVEAAVKKIREQQGRKKSLSS